MSTAAVPSPTTPERDSASIVSNVEAARKALEKAAEEAQAAIRKAQEEFSKAVNNLTASPAAQPEPVAAPPIQPPSHAEAAPASHASPSPAATSHSLDSHAASHESPKPKKGGGWLSRTWGWMKGEGRQAKEDVSRGVSGAGNIVTSSVIAVDDGMGRAIEKPVTWAGKGLEFTGKVIGLPWNALRAAWHWDKNCLWNGHKPQDGKQEKKGSKWIEYARKGGIIALTANLLTSPAVLGPLSLLAQSPALATTAILASPAALFLLWPAITGIMAKRMGKWMQNNARSPVLRNGAWGTALTLGLAPLGTALASLISALPYGATIGSAITTVTGGLTGFATSALSKVAGWSAVKATLGLLGVTSVPAWLAPAIPIISGMLVFGLGAAAIKKFYRWSKGGSEPEAKESTKKASALDAAAEATA